MSNDTIPDDSMLLGGLEREPCYWGGRLCDDDENAYLTDEESKVRARKAAQDIHQLYKAGVPFFSKVAIQELVRQFDRTNDWVRQLGRTAEMEREIFVLRGLDGKEVRYRMQTGEAHAVGDGRREFVKYVVFCQVSPWNFDDKLTPVWTCRTAPMLQYACYQHLTADHRILGDPRLDYCPLRIMYRRYLRDTATGAMVPLEEPQDGSRALAEKVRREFGCVAGGQEADALGRRLEFALAQMGDKLPEVTKIVAFACATISDAERRDAQLQHVLVLALKRILEARRRQQPQGGLLDASVGTRSTSACSMPCFAQDPDYTDVDKKVLAEHGVTVLDDPRGFLAVDDQSAVLSFAPDVCVRQVVADLARPALLVWNTIQTEDESLRVWRQRFGDSKKFETLHELEGSL